MDRKMESNDTVGREVYPLPILIYGRSDCEDTQAVRERLQQLEVPFVEIDIDQDAEGAAFVERVNHGERVTPTIVFGQGTFIIVEPSPLELNQALSRAGHPI